MASPVDTSVKHFRSDMVGAPTLSGAVGTLIAVLDACLINGFDVKSATSLVVVGGVATLSFSGSHSATVDSVVLVSGVTGALTDLNGEQKVTVVGSGVVKFATAAADGTASGTISFKMAPAGYWTKPFSGTNLAVYKSTDPAGTGMYLRIDDTTTGTCRVVGYESMTDVNTGLGAFPTPAQFSGGGYWAKSTLTTSAAVVWELFADSRKFITHVAVGSHTNATYIGSLTRGFGDDVPFRPGGDAYACSLSYSTTPSAASQTDGTYDYASALTQAMPRGYSGLGSCVLHMLQNYTGGVNSLSGTDTLLGPFPSVVDGGLRLSKRYFCTASNQPPRSELPGLYYVPHSLVLEAFKLKDTVGGTGPLTGRKLMALSPSTSVGGSPTSANTGVSFVDITGPWR